MKPSLLLEKSSVIASKLSQLKDPNETRLQLRIQEQSFVHLLAVINKVLHFQEGSGQSPLNETLIYSVFI